MLYFIIILGFIIFWVHNIFGFIIFWGLFNFQMFQVACMMVRPVKNPIYTILFSHGNAVDLGQMSRFTCALIFFLLNYMKN